MAHTPTTERRHEILWWPRTLYELWRDARAYQSGGMTIAALIGTGCAGIDAAYFYDGLYAVAGNTPGGWHTLLGSLAGYVVVGIVVYIAAIVGYAANDQLSDE